MDQSELIHYEYIKTINNLSEIMDADEKLIMLFSAFISNNGDFKYNKTYLTDQIPDFIKCVATFNNKKKKVQEFNKNLIKKYNSLNDWVIIVDNVFIIDSDLKFQLLIDRISELNELAEANTNEELKNKIQGEIMHLRKYVNQFKLFSSDEKSIVFRYLNILSDKDYVKTYNTYKEIKIHSLIEQNLVCLKEKEEDSCESNN